MRLGIELRDEVQDARWGGRLDTRCAKEVEVKVSLKDRMLRQDEDSCRFRLRQ